MYPMVQNPVIFGDRAPEIAETVRTVSIFRVTLPENTLKISDHGTGALALHGEFSEEKQHRDFLTRKDAENYASEYAKKVKYYRSQRPIFRSSGERTHPMDMVLRWRYSFKESAHISYLLRSRHYAMVRELVHSKVANTNPIANQWDQCSVLIGDIAYNALLSYAEAHNKAPDLLELYHQVIEAPGVVRAAQEHMKAKQDASDSEKKNTRPLNKVLPKLPSLEKSIITEHEEEKQMFFVGDQEFLSQEEACQRQRDINQSLHELSIKVAKSLGLKQALQMRRYDGVLFLMENYETEEVLSVSNAFNDGIVNNILVPKLQRILKASRDYLPFVEFTRFRFIDALCHKLHDDEENVKNLPLEMVAHLVDVSPIKEEVDEILRDHVNNKSANNYSGQILGRGENRKLSSYRSSDSKRDSFRKVPRFSF